MKNIYKILFVFGTLLVIFSSMLILAACGILKGSFLNAPLYSSLYYFILGIIFLIMGIYYMIFCIQFKEIK